jgi:hypothetical protein
MFLSLTTHCLTKRAWHTQIEPYTLQQIQKFCFCPFLEPPEEIKDFRFSTFLPSSFLFRLFILLLVLFITLTLTISLIHIHTLIPSLSYPWQVGSNDSSCTSKIRLGHPWTVITILSLIVSSTDLPWGCESSYHRSSHWPLRTSQATTKGLFLIFYWFPSTSTSLSTCLDLQTTITELIDIFFAYFITFTSPCIYKG